MSDRTVETIDLTETTRIRVEYDDGPQCPRGDWHMLTGFVKIPDHGDSRLGDVPAVHDDLIGIRSAHKRADEGSWAYVGGSPAYRRLNRLWPESIVARWALIFHGMHVEWDLEHGGYWFVPLDGPDLFAANWPDLTVGSKEHVTQQAKVIEQEQEIYRQWANGEVYGVILEREITYAEYRAERTAEGFEVDTTIEPVLRDTWDGESVWGFYADDTQLLEHEAIRFALENFDLTEEEEAAARALLPTPIVKQA